MLWIDMNRHVMPLALLATAGLAACAPETSDEAPLGAARSAVIAGTDSDASQDAVVFLVHKDPASARVGMCTGTLVAPNLVLTARHCVADADEGAECAADGTAVSGGAIRANHAPGTLLVYTGKNRPPFASQRDPAPSGVGATIVDDGAKNLCDHDLALVVLKEPLAGVPIAAMRLDGDVATGETFTAVGWGITSTSTKPAVRQQRGGVRVVAVGPDAKASLPVPPTQFEAGEAICLGDSGGPAFAASGALLGVVTGGGNGKQATASDPSAACVGSAAASLYTRLSPFKELVLRGFALAGAEPWLEGEPGPRAVPPDAPEASAPTPAAQAPTTTTTRGGCSGAPARPANGHLALALVAMGLVCARRRRRAP
jgi:V8-like Glu-specific endopeptidase